MAGQKPPHSVIRLATLGGMALEFEVEQREGGLLRLVCDVLACAGDALRRHGGAVHLRQLALRDHIGLIAQVGSHRAQGDGLVRVERGDDLGEGGEVGGAEPASDAVRHDASAAVADHGVAVRSQSDALGQRTAALREIGQCDHLAIGPPSERPGLHFGAGGLNSSNRLPRN